MAIIVAVIGASGSGKTTATVVGPDGKFDPKDYHGLDPRTHFILNLEEERPPLPPRMWNKNNHNYAEASTFDEIRGILLAVSKAQHIKTISIDTINVYVARKEFNDRKKMTFDQWRDLSNDIIELNSICNTVLRPDQVVFIMGHTAYQQLPDGTQKEVFSLKNKNLSRVDPEAFYNHVVIARNTYDGVSTRYFFELKPRNSSAKLPLGMTDLEEIPNSLALLDSMVREFYGLPGKKIETPTQEPKQEEK